MAFDLNDYARKILAFRDRRNWKQYHTPKDLAISISLEAAELLELFQWKNEEECRRLLDGDRRSEVEDELADIAIYILLFCLDQEIDLGDAIGRKLSKNEEKYPVGKSRGSSTKYDRL